jgi:hypothetical protein
VALKFVNADQLLACGTIDCRPPAPPPAAPVIPPQAQSFDYQVKDYDSFLRALLDLIPSRVPGWSDRIEADLGMAIAEVFAYFADKLSYYQDRVFNEGFLRTATQYESVRRLLSLVDYTLDPGTAARVFLAAKVASATVLPAGSAVSTRGNATQEPVVFETRADRVLYPELNTINLAADAPSDAAGVQAVFSGELDSFLPAGSWIFFQRAGASEWAQTAAPVAVDHVLHTSTVTLHSRLDATYPAASSSVSANGIPATHGQLRVEDSRGSGLPDQSFPLSYGPVTFVDDADAKPQTTLSVKIGGNVWRQVPDFIDSGPTDAVFLTTRDNQGFTTIRFGNGAQGRVPPEGAAITVSYRSGIGESGLVAPQALNIFNDPGGAIISLMNPQASFGARNPESLEDAKLLGPEQARTQARAVTPQDYERLLLNSPALGILHAKATYEWTGSWTTVAVSVDFGDRVPMLAAPERRTAIETLLAQKKMAGLDVAAEDARYAPLYIGLVVHVKPEFFARQVRDAVVKALGPSGFFAPGAFGFGQAVHLSDLYPAAMASGGVQYLSVTRFKRMGDRYPDRKEYGSIEVGPLEIIRCDNDPAHPENGVIYVRTCGGLEG